MDRAFALVGLITALCVGVILGLLLRLKFGFLGEIPESTMSLIGAILGASVGAAGSFLGAYFIWQRQLHKAGHLLGAATSNILAPTYAGLHAISEHLAKEFEATGVAGEVTSTGATALHDLAGGLSEAAASATRNLDRVSQQLGAMGAERVPWFMFAEVATHNAQLAADAVLNGKVTGAAITAGKNVNLAPWFAERINKAVNDLAVASQELKSDRPSLERFDAV